MNNEKLNQIIDEAYKNYQKEMSYHPEENWLYNGVGEKCYRQLTQEEFINKCKTDLEFSGKWGLKIEERELDMMERWGLAGLTPNMTEFDYCNKLCDEHKVPTKLITITYNNETLESYE